MSEYRGQRLKREELKSGRVQFYYAVDHRHAPKAWMDKYGWRIFVPFDDADRTGKGDAREAALAHRDAAICHKEYQRMVAAERNRGRWRKGGLYNVARQYRRTEYYRSLKATTQHLHKQCIAQIIKWHEEKHVGDGMYPTIGTITVADLNEFLHSYDDRPAMRDNLRKTLRNLYETAMGMAGAPQFNPCHDPAFYTKTGPGKRQPTRQRKVVLWDQKIVDTMIGQFKEWGYPSAVGLIALMWDIGQRPGDLANLRVLHDVDRENLERGLLDEGLWYDPEGQCVHGWQSKTGKFISIPVDDVTAKHLKPLIPRAKARKSGRMFVRDRVRKPGTEAEKYRLPVDQYWVNHLIKRARRKHRVLNGVTFGTGRHSCIMRLYRAGASDQHVMAITGHTAPSTIRNHYWCPDTSITTEAKRLRQEAENGI